MAITSIWNNPFYNVPPIPKWSWELDFKSYFVNKVNGDDSKHRYKLC